MFLRAEMDIVGGDDGDGVDAVGTLGFGGGHFVEGGVDAVGGDVEIAGGIACAFGI